MEEGDGTERRSVGGPLSLPGLPHHVVVLCTVPQGQGAALADSLVEERLAACASIQTVSSHYTWNGQLCRDAEELLVIKTRGDRAGQLMARIKELHSYQVPEIIVLPILAGFGPYLQWIDESVGPGPAR